MLEAISEAWTQKTAKLGELEDWLKLALKELQGVPQSDARWQTFERIELAAKQLEQEIDELEEQQENALTESLKANGPIILELEDGSTRTLSATAATSGGGECILPRDFLNVWRVAKTFQGSVHLGGERATLRFGDVAQVATVKMAPKIKKAKRDAVVGDEASLFGRD